MNYLDGEIRRPCCGKRYKTECPCNCHLLDSLDYLCEDIPDPRYQHATYDLIRKDYDDMWARFSAQVNAIAEKHRVETEYERNPGLKPPASFKLTPICGKCGR